MTVAVNRARAFVSGDAQYFSAQPQIHEIKTQLDNDSISDKLEAIKRALAQMCKGSDMAEIFPDVVKNIVCTNTDVKKLVYAFVMHYAEEKPNEALLSVSQFQRDMGDRSPFIRALALRVLCSIRVPIIAPVMLLALRKCSGDVSSYVRQTSAIAIPKLNELSPDEKPQLEAILTTLLSDSRPNVVGCAMCAFQELCPERIDLLHKHFRKLCRMLGEFDEWSQITVLGTLTHYARSQFVSPFNREKETQSKLTRKFYESDSGEEGEGAKTDSKSTPHDTDIDVDHRLLLRSAVPLLNSRNKAVVMAVVALYAQAAPPTEFNSKCIKSIMRILRVSREVEFVVLSNVHTLVCNNPEPFRSYLRDFFVYGGDPNFIRQLKLGIMSRLANVENSPQIFKELKTYFRSPDIVFVKQALRVVAHVGLAVPPVAVTCLHMLLALMEHPNTEVVAEAVMILRILLQNTAGEHTRIVAKLSVMLTAGKVTTPIAAASVLWLLGEHCLFPKVQSVAPDVFRIFGKKFATLTSIEKIQVVNMGLKLWLKLTDDAVVVRIRRILDHVLDLGKYDTDFDVRDKCRFLRSLLASSANKAEISTVFLVERPVTCLREAAVDRARFALGTMSHIAAQPLCGYTPLSDFPAEAPDFTVRDAQAEEESTESEDSESSVSFYGDDDDDKKKKKKKKPAYEDDEESSEVSWEDEKSESDVSDYSDVHSDGDAERDDDDAEKGAMAAPNKQQLDNFFGEEPQKSSPKQSPKAATKHVDPTPKPAKEEADEEESEEETEE
jgi:AP-3 complex subunit beta